MLVLDETTANLPAAEAERLFALVRTVHERRVAVLFVSHHFDDVFANADALTVLRDGRLVGTLPVQGLSEQDLVKLVVGRALEEHSVDPAAVATTEVALEVRDLSGAIVDDLNIDVHAGEVVGVAGITGSGREELA